MFGRRPAATRMYSLSVEGMVGYIDSFGMRTVVTTIAAVMVVNILSVAAADVVLCSQQWGFRECILHN